MILESIVSSLMLDGLLRKWRNRGVKNNVRAITTMQRGDSPVFQTVGELRELLSVFCDDTPIHGMSFKYANMQLMDWKPGTLIFGSQSYWEEDDA
jgi:hypothetical protein